jgi:hypothetical protein
MSLLFIDGFDTYTTLSEKYDTTSGGNIGAFGRNGTNGYRGSSAFTKNIPAMQEAIVGFAFREAGIPAGNHALVEFMDGGTVQLTVTVEATTGYIAVRRGGFSGTLLQSTSSGISANVWYYLEFKANIHPTAGTWEVRLNGSTILSGTGNTRNSSNSQLNVVRWAFGSGNRDYDDIYILSTAGTVNNDFLGDVKVSVLSPNGAGNYSGWTPSAGSNYQCVDEIPPNDDTDYVSTATAGTKDSYTFSDLSGSPTVYGVQLTLRHRKDDAGTRTVRPLVRVGGTDYFGSNQSVSDSYASRLQVWETNPGTGNLWAASELNSAEFGVELVS